PSTVYERVGQSSAAWAARNSTRGISWDGPLWRILELSEGAAAPYEQATLRLDTEKAQTRLGWKPVLDFGTALEWAADWYWRHRFEPRFDAAAATQAQIADYEKAAKVREL